ncbi:unnamed protein product [Adineta steineri]|uniref:Retrotransposon gag domain-containing protein n=1 Tax=Adineta steineri TaxID=433720 RepID=A0A819NXG4_9BILA|nr:unnamed protein product [Adineta steineri]
MTGEGSKFDQLLQRSVANLNIMEQIEEQQTELLHRLPTHSSIGTSTEPSNKLMAKSDKYNGTHGENIVTWLNSLQEMMAYNMINDGDRISIAVSYLGGTALQWFVDLTLQNQRPLSWADFKEKIISRFHPADFQEHLRQQLLQLRQKQSVEDYIQSFRSIVDQVHHMDELTQFICTFETSKKSVKEAIREATTYASVMTIRKNNHIKYNPFL